MNFWIFSTLFMVVFGLLAAYVVWRLLAGVRIPFYWKPAGTAVILILILITPATIVLRRSGSEGAILDLMTWIGHMGVGFFSFLFTCVAVRDLGLASAALWRRLKKIGASFRAAPAAAGPGPDPERRRFLVNVVNSGLTAGAGVLTFYGLSEARQVPEVKEVFVPIPNLPPDLSGFRIVQITDVHVSATTKRPFVEAIVQEVNTLSADVVALTGDLVDGSVAWLAHDVEPLSRIRSVHGNFFVTGNHEYYSGVLPWIAHMQKLGFTVLMNEHRTIRRGEGAIALAGVTDYRAGESHPGHRSDPRKAIAGAPPESVKILLAHQPRSIYAAADAGFDLQISGHTHGGQFFPWSLVVYMAQPFVAGLHCHEKTQIYVSRGTGTWGPPIRVGAPSEITLIQLVPAHASA